MKIVDVKTYVVANPPPHNGGAYFVFLKLTADNGIVGFGEVYGVPFHPHRVSDLIEDVVERYVIGWDPFRSNQCGGSYTRADSASTLTCP